MAIIPRWVTHMAHAAAAGLPAVLLRPWHSLGHSLQPIRCSDCTYYGKVYLRETETYAACQWHSVPCSWHCAKSRGIPSMHKLTSKRHDAHNFQLLPALHTICTLLICSASAVHSAVHDSAVHATQAPHVCLRCCTRAAQSAETIRHTVAL
jgi:hypothetical protein